MNATNRLKKAWVIYFTTSSLLMGCNEFVHSFYSYRKLTLQQYGIYNTSLDSTRLKDINFDSCKKAVPSFITGVVLGPILPVLYMAGFRALEFSRCTYLK